MENKLSKTIPPEAELGIIFSGGTIATKNYSTFFGFSIVVAQYIRYNSSFAFEYLNIPCINLSLLK